ncbi:hypothetical protein ABN034_19280 [Actinopolymorpha sp. B11F2]|uniref:baeRF3 domain-containing protein n=1 Tax=Actinopolymorpha sp. B11F2 TaxID=3160862 RepID=UPI0032E51990
MDLLRRQDLEFLIQRDHPGTQVSLFMPTDRSGNDAPAERIRWRNLLRQVESVLARQGVRTPKIAEVLAPAWDLHTDGLAWQYTGDGLAMFLGEGWQRSFRVPVEVPTVGAVGDHVIVGPLLPVLTGDRRFLVLALSQQNVRLLEGSLQHIEEVELTGVPTNMREVVEPRPTRADSVPWVAAGPTGGRAGVGIFYGHGAADKDVKKDDVRYFLHRVAEGMHHVVGGRDLPMVLVGLDYLVAIYREVNTYPHVTEQAVRENSDQYSAPQLHAIAWPIVAEIREQETERAAARISDLLGTGLAANDVQVVAAAAREGRVETLLLAGRPSCWDRLANLTQVVELGASGGHPHCELLDGAAVDTLTQGGRVYAVNGPEVPGGGDIAAILRY